MQFLEFNVIELSGQRNVFTQISMKNHLNIQMCTQRTKFTIRNNKGKKILIAEEWYHPDQVNSGNFDIISLIFI